MVKRASIVFATLIVSFNSLLAVIMTARKFGFDSRHFHDPAKVFAPLTIITALTVMGLPILIVAIVQLAILRESISYLHFRKSKLKSLVQGFSFGVALKGLATFAWLTTTPSTTLSLAITDVAVSEWLPFFSWFLVGLILNSLSEEYVFRAFPIKSLRKHLNPFLIIAISALLFSLMHFVIEEPDLGRFIYRSFFGILAGIIYLRTDSLAWVVGLHTGWNFVSWTISDSAWQVGTIIRINSPAEHREIIWNVALLAIGTIVAIYPFVLRRKLNEHEIIPGLNSP